MDKYPPAPKPLHAVGARPIQVFCPYCRMELQLDPQFAGDVVSCPNCNGKFQSPIARASAASYAGGFPGASELNPGIKICVLVSSVGNILAGLIWISTLCAAPIGIAQIVLAIFEIIYFAQADSKPRHTALSQAKLFGILEIVSGIFNLISLVCGILVLVFAHNEDS